MSCDVDEVTEWLENELCYDYNYELCSFSNLFVASPTSQVILQPFHRYTYVTAHSPAFPLLHLRHSSFSNASFASLTSEALHLIHLASRPCLKQFDYLTWLHSQGYRDHNRMTQEKTTTFGSPEPPHSSWQCKESHHCCHRPLAPLAMGDTGTSTILTLYESMWLRSLRQSERTTMRKRWTYPCYRAVNTERQQRWTHWWCTTPSKHLAKGDK